MDAYREKEQYLTNASAIIKAVANTGIRMFVYYPQLKTIFVPEGTCAAYQCKSEYKHMPESFAEDYVHPDEYNVFNEMYYKIDSGDQTASATFHSKDLKYCNHVTLTTVSWTEEGLPTESIGIIEDVSDWDKNLQVINELQKIISIKEMEEESDEALKVMASSIGSQYYAVYYIDINSHSYTCFQEQLPGILSVIGEKGPYEPAWQKYIDYYIDPEDQNGMRDFSNLSTLADRIGKQTSITRNYRRKNIGWTRGQYIAGKRDENGKLLTVIYTVTDIEKEVTQAKEREYAQYEAQHDPLTGALNRKGLELIVANKKLLKSKIGLAVIDIDNFKQINDRYGHDVGDKILLTLADTLRQAFRIEDYIIRTGGDEFMVLLDNCDATIWSSICRKLKAIHVSLQDEFSGNIEEISITLSVGLCFSETGYNEELFKLADEALYRTKRNGRAGCTLIDSNHNIVKQWTDESLSLYAKNVLTYTNMGICQMEIPFDETKKRRLVCGEAIKILIGLENSATPEECYEAWQRGVDPSYRVVLQEAEQSMITEGQTECTYLWHHPEWGRIYIRSGGIGRVDENMIILQGYHHFLKDIKIVEKENEAKKLLSALNNLYSYSYYLNLESNTYSTFKFTSETDTMQLQNRSLFEIIEEFLDYRVAPVDQDKMRSFLDFKTLQQRLNGEKSIDCEFRSQSIHGWCRAKFLPIRYDSDGKLTHVIFLITSLDEAKGKELDITEYNKRSLNALFDQVPGGIVLYEWNGKKLQVLHMSKYYKELYGYSMLNDSDSPDYLRLHPDDVEDYQKAILKALSETHQLEYVFRVWNEKQKKYGWTQVNAVSEPQPDGTSLVYAMYSDITVQKEMELLSEKRQQSVVNTYESQMKMLLAQNADALCRCNINLTKNQFYDVEAKACIKEYSKNAQTIDEFMKLTSESVSGMTAQQEYRDIFNRTNLLSMFKNGKSRISYECFYHITSTHTEWVETVFDLVTEPDTEDVVGMCYAKSRNEEKLSRILLDASLEKNYPLVALVYADTGEYYRYEKAKGEHCKHRQNYWKTVIEKMAEIVEDDVLQEIRGNFAKDKVLSVLEENPEYAFSFYGNYEGDHIRLEAKYHYVDKEQKLLIAFLHDITDEDLYQKK